MENRMLNMEYRNGRKGSALLFTMMIVALVASLSFFVGRSAVREQKIANATQESLGAYYAAEAGLEDGLARLAADKNLEVPSCAYGKWHGAGAKNATPCDSSDGVNFNTNLSIDNIDKLKGDAAYAFPTRIRIARFGANGAQTSNKDDAALLNIATDLTSANDPALNQNDYMYDLKITSKTSKFGDTDAGGNPSGPGAALKNGATRDFDVPSGVGNPLAPDTLKLFWLCDGVVNCPISANLQITLIYSSGSGGQETTKDILFPSNTSGGSSDINTINRAATDLIKIRIKPLNADVHLSTVLTNVTVGAVPFKSDIVKVQSIGYFGGVQRKLQANVDRASGAILGLFDYAVYAGSSFTQP